MKFKDQYAAIFEKKLIAEIEKVATSRAAEAYETIIDIGETVRSMPIVLSGTLKISRKDEDGNELLLYYVSAKESCAMTFTCCMQQFPSEIIAVAEEHTEILLIPIALMDEWLVRFPTWKTFVMTTIRFRFSELLKTIDQIAFQKLDERLIYYLKEKSKTTDSTIINLSHEQIANDLATSRVVISRLLKKLEIDKRLLLYRNQIKLMRSL